jgi:restriction system protein
LIEEVVASAFRNIGFRACVTAYTCDGGIDVILQGSSSELVGVQVKRYRDRIKAEQIRSLAGALILHGHTQGVFVTTGTYQRGALRTAQDFGERGVPIALMDAQALFDALRIRRREVYATESLGAAPFHPSILPSSSLHLARDSVDELTLFDPHPQPHWI